MVTTNKREFDLCPECLELYGLVDNKGKEKPVSEKNTAEKLYEIIADIIAEVKED